MAKQAKEVKRFEFSKVGTIQHRKIYSDSNRKGNKRKKIHNNRSLFIRRRIIW